MTGMMIHLKTKHPGEYQKYLGQKERFLQLKDQFRGKLRQMEIKSLSCRDCQQVFTTKKELKVHSCSW